MRVLLQRVRNASVSVDGQIVGSVGLGFVALVGVTHQDSAATAQRLAAKTAKLRVFEDEAGLMNLALGDVGGGVLAVSQFTLYADTRKGNRPSFTDAAPPGQGEAVYGDLRDGVARRRSARRDGRLRRAHAGRAAQRRTGDDPAGGLERGPGLRRQLPQVDAELLVLAVVDRDVDDDGAAGCEGPSQDAGQVSCPLDTQALAAEGL